MPKNQSDKHTDKGADYAMDVEDESAPFLRQDQKSSQKESAPLTEPLTHVKNKSFFETFLCCCLRDEKNQLNSQELLAFHSLKFECNILFDPENEEHNKIVHILWTTLTNETKLEKIHNERWKDYGFQGNDPRTDFRGGGTMGLKMFLGFAQNYTGVVQRMIDPTDDFFAAISSINITGYLMRYFHLAHYLEYEKDKSVICSRMGLKNFCAILSKDNEAFRKFHDLLFEDLFDLWKDLKVKQKGVTIADFNVCMDEVRRKMDVAINKEYYKTFSNFKGEYKEINHWDGKMPSLAKIH